MDLTATQQRLYSFILDVVSAQEVCPTNRVMAQRSGLTSASAVADTLGRLQRKGLISIRRYNRARVVCLPDGRQTAEPEIASPKGQLPHWRDRLAGVRLSPEVGYCRPEAGYFLTRSGQLTQIPPVVAPRPQYPGAGWRPKTCQFIAGEPRRAAPDGLNVDQAVIPSARLAMESGSKNGPQNGPQNGPHNESLDETQSLTRSAPWNGAKDTTLDGPALDGPAFDLAARGGDAARLDGKCGAPVAPGSSYCPTHHALCYRPAPQTAEEAWVRQALARSNAGYSAPTNPAPTNPDLINPVPSPLKPTHPEPIHPEPIYSGPIQRDRSGLRRTHPLEISSERMPAERAHPDRIESGKANSVMASLAGATAKSAQEPLEKPEFAGVGKGQHRSALSPPPRPEVHSFGSTRNGEKTIHLVARPHRWKAVAPWRFCLGHETKRRGGKAQSGPPENSNDEFRGTFGSCPTRLEKSAVTETTDERHLEKQKYRDGLKPAFQALVSSNPSSFHSAALDRFVLQAETILEIRAWLRAKDLEEKNRLEKIRQVNTRAGRAMSDPTIPSDENNTTRGRKAIETGIT